MALGASLGCSSDPFTSAEPGAAAGGAAGTSTGGASTAGASTGGGTGSGASNTGGTDGPGGSGGASGGATGSGGVAPVACPAPCGGGERCVSGACKPVKETKFVRFGGTDADLLQLEADEAGNLYALVSHHKGLTIDGITIAPEPAGWGHVILSLSPDLKLRWHLALPSSQTNSATLTELRTSDLGEVYAVGFCAGNPQLGTKSATCGVQAGLYLSLSPGGAVTNLVAVEASTVAGSQLSTVAIRNLQTVTQVSVAGRVGTTSILSSTAFSNGLSKRAGNANANTSVLTDTAHFVLGSMGGSTTLDGVGLSFVIDEFEQPLFLRFASSPVGSKLEAAVTWPVKARFVGATPTATGLAVVGATYDGNNVTFADTVTSGGFIARLTADGVIRSARQAGSDPTRVERGGEWVLSTWAGIPEFAPAGLVGFGAVVAETDAGDYLWGWSANMTPNDVVRTKAGRLFVGGQFRDVQKFAGEVVEVQGSDGIILELSP